jgi:serine phosphatase RsbU (regulator of sigma subunit)
MACRWASRPGRCTAGSILCLAPGDAIVFVTDGITEARAPKSEARPDRDLFGYNGLTRTAREAATAAARGSLRDIGQTILARARGFAGGKLQDDACLLLARRR